MVRNVFYILMKLVCFETAGHKHKYTMTYFEMSFVLKFFS